MPFVIALKNRLLNAIKQGYGQNQALNFASLAFYTATTDVDGYINITFDQPYAEDSTLMYDWQPAIVDLTGLTEEEVYEALVPCNLYVTELTNEAIELRATTRDQVEAIAADSSAVTVAASTLAAVADKTFDILIIEIAA